MKGKLGWALLVLTLSLAIAAGAQAKITSIRLKYVSASLRAGKSAVMPYTVKPSADKGNVTWSSSNESVATVSRAGRVTAIKAGTATITARASDGSAISSSCKLTVKPPAITKVTLNKTSITANASDESVALSASVTPAVAGVGGLKWTSSNKKKSQPSQARAWFPSSAKALA